MRVLLCCLQALRPHPIPAYAFWKRYFTRGLEEGEHEWIEVPDVDWAEALRHDGAALTDWRARTWPLVVDFITREHRRQPIDLLLGYFFPTQVDVDAVVAIRRLGVPCVNFFCDNVRWFTAIPREYAAFDLHWVPEKKALPMYRAAGLRALYAPMPCWVDPALRTDVVVERFPPTFIGSRDVQREVLLASALAKGGSFQIRGAGWEGGEASAAAANGHPSKRSGTTMLRNQTAFIATHGWRSWMRKLDERMRRRPGEAVFRPVVRPVPSFEEYESVLRESTVTVGVNRYPSFRHPFDRPNSYSRLRDIEAPMLGACYLTEWTEGLDDLYDLDAEIAIYRTADELVDKLRALAADPAKRAALRNAGRRRALAEHTVPRTVARIARELGSGR